MRVYRQLDDLKIVALFIPLTSLGFLSFIPSNVKPIWLIFSSILGLIALLKSIKSGRLPISIFLLVLFVLYVSLSGFFLNLVYDKPYYRGASPIGQFLRGVLPVILGSLLYIYLYHSLKVRKNISKFIVFLTYSVSLSAAWAVIQFVFSRIDVPVLPNIISAITYFLVDTDKSWMDRPFGFALEASWLASQVTNITLPILLFMYLKSIKIFNLRIGSKKTDITLILIVLNLLAMAVSGSRIGMAVGIATLVIGLACEFIVKTFRGKSINLRSIILVFAAPYIVIVMFFAGSNIPYFKSTFESIQKIDNQSKKGFEENVSSLYLGPRFAALTSAWMTFNDHLILGVGIGNSGRFFSSNVPRWAKFEPEVQRWLSDNSDERPNAKNLIVKILSETGIVGGVIYLLFILTNYRNINSGSISLVAMIAFANFADFFSLDSMLLPHIWISLIIVRYSSAISEITSSPQIQNQIS